MKKSSLIRAYHFTGFRTQSRIELIDNGFVVKLVRRQKKRFVVRVGLHIFNGMIDVLDWFEI